MGKGQGAAHRKSMHQTSYIPETDGYPSASSTLKQFYDQGGWLADMITGGSMGQAIVQDANNNYNRMLYENYQSPSAMAAQYEQAGLNRNFATEGAQGNIAQGSAPNVRNNSIGNIVSFAGLLNSFLGALNEGTNLIRNVQAVPLDIAQKKWANMISELSAQGQGYKNTSAFAKSLFDEIFYGNYPVGEHVTAGGNEYNPALSPAMKQQNLRNSALSLMNSLRNYDLQNLKPAEQQKLQEQINLIGKQAGLTEKNIDWYSSTSLGKILGPILGVVLRSIL